MNRREFITSTMMAAGWTALAPLIPAAAEPVDQTADLLKRLETAPMVAIVENNNGTFEIFGDVQWFTRTVRGDAGNTWHEITGTMDIVTPGRNMTAQSTPLLLSSLDPKPVESAKRLITKVLLKFAKDPGPETASGLEVLTIRDPRG